MSGRYRFCRSCSHPNRDKECIKTSKHDNFLCSEIAELAQILDHRFGGDIKLHCTILRIYVAAPLEDGETGTEKSSNELQTADGASFMGSLLN